MGMFDALTTEGLEDSKDVLGGNFDPIPSNVYDGEIKIMYAGKSKTSDAQNVTVIFVTDGKEVRETLYVTNKAGQNFYPDKQDKTKKQPLPGFTLVDEMCMFGTEKGLAAQQTEEKMVNIWNNDERKEVPTPTEVLTDMTGKPMRLAILRQIVDKQKKDANGVYQNTGETRTENAIDKAMHIDTGRTINEYKHGVETSVFRDGWLKKNEGKDRPRAKGLTGAAGPGATGSGMPAGVSASPSKSLFGNKG